jgi:hypothetical protein
MTYDPDADPELAQRDDYERDYRRQLARHPDPRDPDHPGAMYFEEDER